MTKKYHFTIEKYHRKEYKPTIKQDEVLFTGGIGCKEHSNCFTCPFVDCESGMRSNATKAARRYLVPLEEHDSLMHSILPYTHQVQI